MTVKAYLLIDAEVGQSDAVVGALEGQNEVVLVNRVTGPYDVIVAVEVDDLYALGKFVTRHVHAVSGVKNTLTCLKVSS